MIEDVEEGLLGLLLTDQPLNIINDQHIHLLVEVDERPSPWATVEAVTDELCLELGGRHIAHPQIGVKLDSPLPNRLAEVGLAHPTGAVDEEEVERRLPRACSRSLSNT